MRPKDKLTIETYVPSWAKDGMGPQASKRVIQKIRRADVWQLDVCPTKQIGHSDKIVISW